MRGFADEGNLIATVYSVNILCDCIGAGHIPEPALFRARARFVRHPAAPKGQIEACVRNAEGGEVGGARWPCRTRAALHAVLENAIDCFGPSYVLVVRRGPRPAD